MLETTSNLLQEIATESRELYRQRQVILSFGSYLENLAQRPSALIRNAATYIQDTFDHFGSEERPEKDLAPKRFKLFDFATEKQRPIVGGEGVQEEIYHIVQRFVRQGYSDKLILMHGPNGSAKSSTVEAIGNAMQRYSELDEGAVYRFNWVFPTAKVADSGMKGDPAPIGFGDSRGNGSSFSESYALIDESKISARIPSEYKDNPVYLIPMPQREMWLRRFLAKEKGIREEDVELPPHVLLSGLSKRNQLILENLLAAYDGDFSKVLRHVQVERFYYSCQYRVGIASVEPQMSIDAHEKQLTLDRSISNLPNILQNISFHEAQGQLVEANRGLLEFSDLLKRPLEAFKYLLTTIEKATVSLPTSTSNLDIVFLATTNEKHLDAFKTVPDFSSFRERFELVTVPYLLRPSLEERIYRRDVEVLSKSTTMAPHSVRLLSVWAVMTRLKQPDPEHYENQARGLIAKLDPRTKVRLYESESLADTYKPDEEMVIRELRSKIMRESQGLVVYEGRFGASPREVRAILQRASQSPRHKTLTPMAIFDELEKLVKDRTIYEFLQFEPRGKYHDATQFIEVIRQDFSQVFEQEILSSMNLVEDGQYESLLERYVDHVVADVKKEKIYNTKTAAHEQPSKEVMEEVEKLIGVQGEVAKYREALLRRIAAYKIDHPSSEIDVSVIFSDLLKRIKEHYYKEKNDTIERNFRAMLALDTDDEKNLIQEEAELARTTTRNLEEMYGYDSVSVRECLKFMLSQRARKGK